MRRGDPEEPSSASEGDKENERPAQRYASTSAHTPFRPLEKRSRTLAKTCQVAEEINFP